MGGKPSQAEIQDETKFLKPSQLRDGTFGIDRMTYNGLVTLPQRGFVLFGDNVALHISKDRPHAILIQEKMHRLSFVSIVQNDNKSGSTPIQDGDLLKETALLRVTKDLTKARIVFPNDYLEISVESLSNSIDEEKNPKHHLVVRRMTRKKEKGIESTTVVFEDHTYCAPEHVLFREAIAPQSLAEADQWCACDYILQFDYLAVLHHGSVDSKHSCWIFRNQWTPSPTTMALADSKEKSPYCDGFTGNSMCKWVTEMQLRFSQKVENLSVHRGEYSIRFSNAKLPQQLLLLFVPEKEWKRTYQKLHSSGLDTDLETIFTLNDVTLYILHLDLDHLMLWDREQMKLKKQELITFECVPEDAFLVKCQLVRKKKREEQEENELAIALANSLLDSSKDSNSGQSPIAQPTATTDTSESRNCVVCLERPRSQLALPCRHLALCDTCAAAQVSEHSKSIPTGKSMRCAICRQVLVTFIQVYV